MITFQDVSKVYENGFQAVTDVSFEIKKGEFLVLIGPSGSGKSTTMKMINGIIPHSSGKILFNGKDIDSFDPAELRRSIGYVIQQIGLFPHYTIGENVAIVPELKKWDKDQINKRVDVLLDMVGLDPEIYRDRYPKQLSGGQQQRVGVARALASDPDVILMDEPFGALDPITRDQLQKELLTLQKKLQKTIVFVTHDMDEALQLGDRIAIMKDGELVQCDRPEAILQSPKNDFVEEFIGRHQILQNPDLMRVTEVMEEEFVTTSPQTTPEKALSKMRQNKLNHILVVDDLGKLHGLVSAFDVINYQKQADHIEKLIDNTEKVLNVESTAKDAIMQISDQKYGVIPIVNERNILTGVVTRATLLDALSSQWTEELEVIS